MGETSTYCAERGAGEGNRTLVVSLEGFCSTIELHPHGPLYDPLPLCMFWWRRLDSNQRRRKPTDLQSAPFSHSGTPPQRTDDYGGIPTSCQALRGDFLSPRGSALLGIRYKPTCPTCREPTLCKSAASRRTGDRTDNYIRPDRPSNRRASSPENRKT